MRNTLISITLAAATAFGTTAFAEKTEGRQLAELSFEAVDEAGRGYIDHGEFTNFGDIVFLSMDTNESNDLSLKEFLSWGFGMDQVAEEAGRAEALETAMRVVFAFWDLDNDNLISKSEHRKSLLRDFRRADVNGDAILHREEFLNGFSVLVAQRAAINPPEAN